MKIKEKHCNCEEWKKAYREAWSCSRNVLDRDSEVIKAQERGKRCPFCDKKLIEKRRKAFVTVCFPVMHFDKPEGNESEYFISIEEFKEMLKE